MFFKNIRSPLEKALNPYEHLFIGWEKNQFDDGSIEECSYTKDKLKILFQEDLREHIVNLSVLHSSKKYIRVYFRQCLNFSDELDVEDLINSLQELDNLNCMEDQEIAIYLEFLKKNKII